MEEGDTEFNTTQLDAVIKTTKYLRFKTHWIKELIRIYKGGDKGGTTRSTNSATTNDIAT